MEIYKPMSSKELSQRKIEEYSKMAKIVQWGRKNPVKFCELFFGLKLIDYQSYCFMKTWTVQYALWAECRGAGKDTLAAAYNMTRLLLIPDYSLYISSNTYAQSVESFNKLRDIALKRIPSFATFYLFHSICRIIKTWGITSRPHSFPNSIFSLISIS